MNAGSFYLFQCPRVRSFSPPFSDWYILYDFQRFVRFFLSLVFFFVFFIRIYFSDFFFILLFDDVVIVVVVFIILRHLYSCLSLSFSQIQFCLLMVRFMRIIALKMLESSQLLCKEKRKMCVIFLNTLFHLALTRFSFPFDRAWLIWCDRGKKKIMNERVTNSRNGIIKRLLNLRTRKQCIDTDRRSHFDDIHWTRQKYW